MQDRSDYRSQYGYIITWFGGPIFWQSKKHGHVGESSAEDEYMALCHAYKCVCWLRNVFKEAGLEKYLGGPTKVLGDNEQAGRCSREDMITAGNRFIERQYFKTKEGIEKGEIETLWVSGKLNCSDVMTKAVSREVTETLGAMLAGRKDFPDMPEPEDTCELRKHTQRQGVMRLQTIAE